MSSYLSSSSAPFRAEQLVRLAVEQCFEHVPEIGDHPAALIARRLDLLADLRLVSRRSPVRVERTVACEPRHFASRGSPQPLGARRARIATADREPPRFVRARSAYYRRAGVASAAERKGSPDSLRHPVRPDAAAASKGVSGLSFVLSVMPRSCASCAPICQATDQAAPRHLPASNRGVTRPGKDHVPALLSGASPRSSVDRAAVS
jgi:hypothetical protein